MTHTVLITGTNRGLGLEFVKQYAQDNWRVLACCRDPGNAPELQKLQQQFSNIAIYQLDVTKQEQITALAQQLAREKIDLLINNAGVIGNKGENFGDIPVAEMQEVYAVNVIAPLKIIEALINNVAQSELKQIVQLSSSMGSISQNTYGRTYPYRASKAAVNMVMKNLSLELAERGIKVLILDPGWVKPAMGGADAPIAPAESIAGMRKMISKHRDKTGVFYGYDGEEIPW